MNAAVSKTVSGLIGLTRVRIPPPPLLAPDRRICGALRVRCMRGAARPMPQYECRRPQEGRSDWRTNWRTNTEGRAIRRSDIRTVESSVEERRLLLIKRRHPAVDS